MQQLGWVSRRFSHRGLSTEPWHGYHTTFLGDGRYHPDAAPAKAPAASRIAILRWHSYHQWTTEVRQMLTPEPTRLHLKSASVVYIKHLVLPHGKTVYWNGQCLVTRRLVGYYRPAKNVGDKDYTHVMCISSNASRLRIKVIAYTYLAF